jgi:hypothetical protein
MIVVHTQAAMAAAAEKPAELVAEEEWGKTFLANLPVTRKQ